MVSYGAITQQSVGDLLMAGIIPGLIIASGFAIYTYFAAVSGGFDQSEGIFSLGKLWNSFRKCIWAVFVPEFSLFFMKGGR